VIEQLERARYRESLLREDPRYADPKRLFRYSYKVFSQDDEDGAIAEIFRRIGVEGRRFIEIGVGDGLECNSLNLLVQGWSGHWVDTNKKALAEIQKRFGVFLGKTLGAHHHHVNAGNIDNFLNALSKGSDLDLLSIDIDGNDYWVWNAVTSVQARVVVIEYNASWHPPLNMTVEYNPEFKWEKTNYFGASLSALTELGAKKGYNLVGCCFSGSNAYFVRRDLCGAHFAEPFTAENHYEPPRYWIIGPSGHPPGFGPVTYLPIRATKST
jgi:hypothetical protein